MSNTPCFHCLAWPWDYHVFYQYYVMHCETCLAESAYQEACQQLLDRKDAMMCKYRYLLMLESMVCSASFLLLYFFSHSGQLHSAAEIKNVCKK